MQWKILSPLNSAVAVVATLCPTALLQWSSSVGFPPTHAVSLSHDNSTDSQQLYHPSSSLTAKDTSHPEGPGEASEKAVSGFLCWRHCGL